MKSATTAYERACGRFYSRKIAMFGEAVMGFLRASLKGLSQWTRGVWLSKAISNDSHIIGTPTGIFLTRSIRRLPTSFDLELLGELTASPWNCGCASLGHRLVHAKRVVPPPAVAFDSSLRLPDKDAKAVQDYAKAHPFEDVDSVDETAISAEAVLLGQAEQPQDGEQEPIFNDEGLEEAVAAAKRASRAQSMNVDVPQTPVCAETSSRPSGKHNTQHDVTGGGSKRFHATAVEASSGHGDVVPQTPQSDAPAEVLDDASSESMQPVSKEARLDDTGHLGRLGQILKIEHLDIEPDVNFEMDEVDTMIQHELNLNEDPCEIVDDVGPNVDELSFPYSPQEPELSADELQHLDSIADQREVERLPGLQVLQEDNLPHDAKSLSTRFVRTWREKKDKQGNAIWLRRRRRLVAREYTWLQPDREALFSPATSNIASRILPVCFLALREHQDTMMVAIDVKDAFLTVKQEQPTRVRCTDASGRSVSYSLGRVLPGQRDGSLLWHRDLVKFVGESSLGMEEFEAYPSILLFKPGDCLLMIHVDDLLVVGSRKAVTEELIPHMQSRYEVSIEIMSNAADELTFLKRTHQLLESGCMVVKIHGKH